MPNFVTESYDKLVEKRNKVENFFADLENQLTSISAPAAYHMDIYWDGSKVNKVVDNSRIQDLSLEDRFRYYDQGVGLMKLAINKQLYPR